MATLTLSAINNMKEAAKKMSSEELLNEYRCTAVWNYKAKNKEAFGDEHLMAIEVLDIIRDELMNRLAG